MKYGLKLKIRLLEIIQEWIAVNTNRIEKVHGEQKRFL